MTRTDPTGRYDFHGLLPGPYLIAVDATGVIDDSWDVTALMQLSPSARRIVLGPGQTMELELTRR
jgi:protocatechuate 3,4-dioxygenase beta subunit